MIFVITKFYFFLCFVLGLVLTSCVEVCVKRWSCVLPALSCNFSVEVPLWKVLCGYSEILLCEGGNVEQWLELQNISLCLRLDLSLLYLALPYIVHIIYMLGIICVPTLVFNQESF